MTTDTPLEVVVFATDFTMARKTVHAYRELGYNVEVLGLSLPPWDSTEPGGICKLRWLAEYLKEMPDRHKKIILASDGYDVCPILGPEELLKRFKAMDARIVVAGDTDFDPPDNKKKYEELFAAIRKNRRMEQYPYLYPNSGLMIGYANEIYEEIKNVPHRDDLVDDQHFMQRSIIEDGLKMYRIDYEAELFQCLGDGSGAWCGRSRGRPYNWKTKRYPAILHANRRASIEAVKPMTYVEPELRGDAWEWIEVAPGILCMPFMTEATAERIELVSSLLDNLWGRDADHDSISGDVLPLWRIDIDLALSVITSLTHGLSSHIANRWRPAKWNGVADALVQRNTKDALGSMRLYDDPGSYFSCSVKLKEPNGGGELVFPRQNYSDRLVPVGSLLVWPSQITHPYMMTKIKYGEGISLRMWT